MIGTVVAFIGFGLAVASDSTPTMLFCGAALIVCLVMDAVTALSRRS